jgi:hypothetical protein
LNRAGRERFRFYILELAVQSDHAKLHATLAHNCPNPETRQYIHAQIGASLENNGGQIHLESDSKKPPRPRHRFSFSGQSKKPAGSTTPHPAAVTRNDILDSLTKYAHPQQGPVEEVAQFQDPSETAVPARTRNRGSARGALVVFLGGFLAVWLYGYVTGAYEIPYLRGVTESPEVQVGVQLISSNPILFGVGLASVLFGALYLRHRKRN